MNRNYEQILYDLSTKAFRKNEVPVAALIVFNNKIIAKAYNRRYKHYNPLNHAEIRCVIKAAKKLKTWKLNQCELYVTLEPCHMCKEIIKETRIKKVHFYEYSSKSVNYKTEFLKQNSIGYNFSELLTIFFKKRRK